MSYLCKEQVQEDRGNLGHILCQRTKNLSYTPIRVAPGDGTKEDYSLACNVGLRFHSDPLRNFPKFSKLPISTWGLSLLCAYATVNDHSAPPPNIGLATTAFHFTRFLNAIIQQKWARPTWSPRPPRHINNALLSGFITTTLTHNKAQPHQRSRLRDIITSIYRIPVKSNVNGMIRGNRGNPVDRGVRPHAGRGSIVSGSRAQEIHRRREHGSSLGLGRGRGPQVGRSLVDRMTFARTGRGGVGAGAPRPRFLADRITFDSGGGPQNNVHAQGRNADAAGGQRRARPLVDRMSIDLGGNGETTQGTVHAVRNADRAAVEVTPGTEGSSLFVSSQPTRDRFERETSTLSDSSLFNDVSTMPPPRLNTTRVNTPASIPAIKIINEKPKAKPARVIKDPIKRLFKNEKLRNLLSGRRPPKAPKRHDQMLLRLGKATTGFEGYELVCNSPAHD